MISVVMPCYNAEKYIAEAIESVLNQTYTDFEFIIINDASTDKSLDIIKEYAKKDKRIKFLNNERNVGISETRNKGIRLAEGKYIATHDADDISLPTRFEEQISHLERIPSCGVVGSYLEIFDSETGKVLGIRKYAENDKDLRDKIFFYCPVAQPASIIRKEVFIKLGLYDNRYPPAEDLDLWFRLGTEYKFSNIPKILLKYRYYAGSATTTKIEKIEKISNKLRWKNWNNKAYYFGFNEFSFNLLHLISIYIIPSHFKLWLFNKLRDERI